MEAFYILQNPEAIEKKKNEFYFVNIQKFIYRKREYSEVKYKMTNWKKLFVTHINGKR